MKKVDTLIKKVDTSIKKRVVQTLGHTSRQHYQKRSKFSQPADYTAPEIPPHAALMNTMSRAAHDAANLGQARNAYTALLEPTSIFESLNDEKNAHQSLLARTRIAQAAHEVASLGKAHTAYERMLEANKQFSPEDLKFYDTYGGRRKTLKSPKRFR